MKKALLTIITLGLLAGCASFKTSSGREASIDTTGDGIKGSYKDPNGNELQFDTKPE